MIDMVGQLRDESKDERTAVEAHSGKSHIHKISGSMLIFLMLAGLV